MIVYNGENTQTPDVEQSVLSTYHRLLYVAQSPTDNNDCIRRSSLGLIWKYFTVRERYVRPTVLIHATYIASYKRATTKPIPVWQWARISRVFRSRSDRKISVINKINNRWNHGYRIWRERVHSYSRMQIIFRLLKRCIAGGHSV